MPGVTSQLMIFDISQNENMTTWPTQTTLNLHRFGDPQGVPLLAIHGITAHGARYAPMSATVFAGRNVVSPDLRGHGNSPCEAPWNLETHVEDLIAVLDSLGWDCVDVMGHSLGGNLALRLLSAHPGRVKRVMLLDPAFDLPAADMTGAARSTMPDDSFATQAELIEARRAGRSEAALPHSDADVLISSFAGDDGRWRMRFERAAAVAMWAELARPLPPINSPVATTLVVATQAGLVTDKQRAYLHTNFEELLTEIDLDLGHMLYWDDFELSCRVIEGWLNG